MMDESPNGFAEQPILNLENARPVKVEDFRKDHRKRLRHRFMNGGAAEMPDYELLEVILFRAIPRQDVKPLAHRLIHEFGDFNTAISSTAVRLSSVKGVGQAVIQEMQIVEAAAHRLVRARVIGREVLSSWDALIEYCTASMAYLETEQFRILFLDKQNILIADEEQQTGTVDHVPVYPREVAKRALELNASSLILVHNHPPSPSNADIDMTGRIQRALVALSIKLHDHIIIGKNKISSFHDLDLL